MNKRTTLEAISFIVVFSFLFFGAVKMHPFGTIENPVMDEYIIENAQNETGANNVVTSVVFDYRGFDTLGEATILFTAVAGVVALFRKVKKEEEKEGGKK
jgi:multisubunit Na+/H+ antiporter MnhB subunit